MIDKQDIGSIAEQIRSMMSNKQTTSSAASNNGSNNGTNNSNRETSPPKSTGGASPGISINLNATEILKILITEHFFATCAAIVVISCIIAAIKYNYDLTVIISYIVTYLTATSVGAIVLALVIATCTMCIIYKINNIAKANKIHEVLHNTLCAEINDMQAIIVKMNDKNGNLTTNLGMLSDLVSENVIDIRKIVNTLEAINNTLKRIPDKSTILDILTIRTKLIFSSVIEVIAEYLSNIIVAGRSKRSFMENKLKNKLEEVKSQYLTEITILSKNTLDNDIRDKMIECLDKAFERILFLIVNTEDINTIDELLSNIGYVIKDLTVTLTNMYDNNLLLTTFLEEGGGSIRL